MSDQGERGHTTAETDESEARFSAENNVDTDAGSTDSVWDQATDEWYVWLTTAVAVAVAAYLYLTESLVDTTAESFYAIIFLLMAVAVFGYGLRNLEGRRTPL